MSRCSTNIQVFVSTVSYYRKMVSVEAKVALQNFIFSFIIFFMISLANITYNISALYVNISIIFPCIILTLFSTKLAFKGIFYQIAVRSSLLGIVCALGIYVKLVTPPHIQIFGPYMFIIAFFHYSEFLMIALVQPEHVSIDSFMLNHSLEYKIAALASSVEFALEAFYFPALKQWHIISHIGVCICVAGEILRKVAIVTAGKNFNHLVQCEKVKGHTLVTHGVYSWFRHPSYVGWFYWSLGTQVTLLNPVCLVAYAIASWRFFQQRIYIEEITLLNFFGQQYCDYQQHVGTGLPFITGYRI